MSKHNNVMEKIIGIKVQTKEDSDEANLKKKERRRSILPSRVITEFHYPEIIIIIDNINMIIFVIIKKY